jgi:hypothetical protein
MSAFVAAAGKHSYLLGDSLEEHEDAFSTLIELLPKFFYFSNYDMLLDFRHFLSAETNVQPPRSVIG